MNMFYDPQKKKVQPWLYVVIILIPIVLIMIVLIGGKNLAENQKAQNPEQEEDVFDKF